MDYFAGCNSDEARKKRFRDLAKQHHPDKGGNADVFKEINRQYNGGPTQSKQSSAGYGAYYGSSFDSGADHFKDAFQYSYRGFWDTGDWDFTGKAEAKRKQEQERKQREEEKKIKEAYEAQEATNRFYRDKSQPRSEHGEHTIAVNSRDTLKMFSVHGNHEYRYDVFSDTWVRK